MSLRPSTDYEIGGIRPPYALCSICHSRAGGNPRLFTAELAWIPAFAGMTELRWSIGFAEHAVIGIFRGGHEEHEGRKISFPKLFVAFGFFAAIFRIRISYFVIFVPFVVKFS
jgi:hypothetical protein